MWDPQMSWGTAVAVLVVVVVLIFAAIEARNRGWGPFKKRPR